MPFGSWPSPISASLIVAASASLGEVAVGTDDVWWSELRPNEGGRVAIVRHRPGGERVDVLPPGFSARTRVHEYGGGAWWLHDDALFFANWADQRLYRIDGDGEPTPLTPEPAVAGGDRYADGRVTPDGRWVICVRERHGADAAEPVNEIVALSAHDGGEPEVLVGGADFVSFPRISPDGGRLCWTQWNHPDMPWDAAELWVADLAEGAAGIVVTDRRRLAGGQGESIFQPTWGSEGDLLYVSDRTDWWNLYRIDSDDRTTSVFEVAGEVGVPQWVFDQSRFVELADGRLLCAVAAGGIDRLVVVDRTLPDGAPQDVPGEATAFSSLRAFGRGAVCIAGFPAQEPVVLMVDIPRAGSATTVVLRAARDLGIEPRWYARPEPMSFPTSGGATAHALYYPPTNPDVDAPSDELPPLIVLSHGGPTSAARPQLNLTIQYWTSRGIAVADVNYRGSTGYGRRYRDALDGEWGVIDVEDCVAAAEVLVERGMVDPARLAIRGGSAGGFTTLCALTFHDTFRAGASLYGVADLEALARDTHKFEARYLDGLVGPYPAERDLYVQRSPINHTDRLACPLIIFQGLEDEIVPPNQAEMMVEALRARKVPFAYVAFEGEQHGFRQASTIERVLEAELYFYARVFGFDLADAVEPVRIENL